MESEVYKLTKAGKIAPAPYSKICDWVVKAWEKVQPDTIGNSFSHNGWFQAFNNNDTSVLHTLLCELVDKMLYEVFSVVTTPKKWRHTI